MNGAARLAINNTHFHSFISVTVNGGKLSNCSSMFIDLTDWPLGDTAVISNLQFPNSYEGQTIFVKLSSGECHTPSLAYIASSNDLVPSGNKPNEQYMSQCCPRSTSAYGITRWQWIKPIKQCKEPLTPNIVIFLWNEVADQWILHTDGQ